MMDDARHLDDDLLLAYADDPANVPSRDEVERHLDACAACWTRLDDFRILAAAMMDEETWWAAGEMPEGARGMRELVARRAAEDAEAERMLRPLLDSPYRFAYANIARKKRFQTGGVARLLCRMSVEHCDSDPRFALVLAEAACVIAEGLPDEYYPSAAVNELRGTAWKEYSTASRYLAQFDAAFDALHRAERAYRRLSDFSLHVASVDLGRALILWEQQRYDEALSFARSAGRQFEDRRDVGKYFNAKEVEATILHRMGDVAAACETYRTAFDLADLIGDAEMKARAARNLGVASRDRGDVGTASKFLLIALQLYASLRQPVASAQTQWAIARLALAGGNALDASRRLAAITGEFTRLGMAADAARSQLDLAEALLMLGRFDEVQSVCGALVSYFRQARMITGALTAAAFLKEAASSGTLTRNHIDHVRTYLTQLERRPELPFPPPPAD